MRFPVALALSGAALCVSAWMPAVAARAAVLSVPAQYPTIQKALAKAAPGDTIAISPRNNKDPFYREAVRVTVPNVTLQGLNGATLDGGAFPAPDPAAGTGGVTGISVEADGVTIRDLTVQNFTRTDNVYGDFAAVRVQGRKSCFLRNNRLRGNLFGVVVIDAPRRRWATPQPSSWPATRSRTTSATAYGSSASAAR
jgi:nitrous oxidase accessory protein NosD